MRFFTLLINEYDYAVIGLQVFHMVNHDVVCFHTRSIAMYPSVVSVILQLLSSTVFPQRQMAVQMAIVLCCVKVTLSDLFMRILYEPKIHNDCPAFLLPTWYCRCNASITLPLTVGDPRTHELPVRLVYRDMFARSCLFLCISVSLYLYAWTSIHMWKIAHDRQDQQAPAGNNSIH